jgi:hypothetical protein
MYQHLLLVETYVKCIRTFSAVLDWAVRLAFPAYRTVSTIFLSVGIHIRHGYVIDDCTKNLLLGSLPRGIQEGILSGWGVQHIADIFFQDITNFVSQDCKVAPGHGSEVMLPVKQLSFFYSISRTIAYRGVHINRLRRASTLLSFAIFTRERGVLYM